MPQHEWTIRDEYQLVFTPQKIRSEYQLVSTTFTENSLFCQQLKLLHINEIRKLTTYLFTSWIGVLSVTLYPVALMSCLGKCTAFSM